MGFRNWLTKNASKVVNETVEQSKQNIVTAVGNKTDLYYKLGRIGLLLVLMWLTGKETGGYLQDGSGNSPKNLPQPNSVIINNYIYDDRKERGNKE